jgi:hypothetical protein
MVCVLAWFGGRAVAVAVPLYYLQRYLWSNVAEQIPLSGRAELQGRRQAYQRLSIARSTNSIIASVAGRAGGAG